MTPLISRVALGATLVGLLAGAGCTGTTPAAAPPERAAPALRLVAFSTCDDALAGLRKAARDSVGPYGFPGQVGPLTYGGVKAAGDPGAAPGGDARRDAFSQERAPSGRVTAEGPAQSAGGPAHSGTNTHEAGVDEPDLIKTDGRRIVTVHQGRLRVIDAASRRAVGSLDLVKQGVLRHRWAGVDLLLHGDRALVLIPAGNDLWPATAVRRRPGALPPTGAVALLVDLSGSPRLLSRLRFDGLAVDVRQVGTTARLVVRSFPTIEFPSLDTGSEADRTAANRRIVDRATIEDFLPGYELAEGGRTTTGRVSCDRLSRPASHTGTSMLTVLTFDLTAPGLGTGDPVTIAADGDTVYGTESSLYVASNGHLGGPRRADIWSPTQDQTEPRTELFKFDTRGAQRPRFVAGGAVPGDLINQYAMSEWDGRLRVAATTGGLSADQSVSTVYVLRERGAELVVEGSVTGLGKGESIYAVRFAGPVGYVVTFRQTDPLYTLDLANPRRPRVLGELKITGYSAYLHPIGGDRLIGVGQEATPQGQTRGMQVSLFDVSDLESPRRVAQRHLPGRYSEAEVDPHAFLYWPADRLLVLPMTGFAPNGRIRPDAALVLRVDDDGLTEAGVILQHKSSGPIRRSLVIGDTLWLLFDDGLRALDMSTLKQRASIAL